MIDTRFRDPAAGNYREFLLRDWSPVAATRPTYLANLAGERTHNTRIHLLEAITTYHELVAHGPWVAGRLAEAVALTEGALVRSPAFYFRASDSRRRPASPTATISRPSTCSCAPAPSSAGAAARPPSTAASPTTPAPGPGPGPRRRVRGRPGRRRGRPAHAHGLGAGGDAAHPGRAVPADPPGPAQDGVPAHARLGRPLAGRLGGRLLVRPSTGPRPGGAKAGPWGGPYQAGRAVLGCLRLIDAITAGAPKGGCTPI